MDGSPLEGLSTGTIVFCLQEIGLSSCFMTGVAPVTPADHFTGRARTLRLLPLRADVLDAQRARGPLPNRVAMDELSPGEVLVIDARGVLEVAVGGDLIVARVKAVGGRALVTDGCVRDLPGLRKLDFPVYAAGVNANLSSTRHVGIDIGQPIACGGVLVMPGDIIVGDAEGVAVVPAQLEQKIAELAAERDAMDAFSLMKIEQGAPLSRAFPLDKELRAEFERTRARRGAAG